MQFYDATAPEPERGFTVIQLGPAHPAATTYLPVAGIGLSYHSAFVPLLGPFLSAINHGEPHTGPTFADGMVISSWLDAALDSARTGNWISM